MSEAADRRGTDGTMVGESTVAQSMPRSRAGHDPDDIPPGAVIGGRYRVERKLGGGAIGNVYECTNTWTTRRVALKLLRRDFADDPEIAQRFLIEARAATTVAHPNIVDVLDMGEDPESKHLYLVQEFLEGRDLHEHLKAKGHLTVGEARDVLLPVMHALAAAHEKGVLHRDLKPENVFLVTTPEGELYPKVIDFGLARTNATAMNRVTRVGAVMGTPFYMSPEQARGESNLDARTDVWAMGVIWYETLSGAVPFEGDNLQAVLHQIFMVDPAPLAARAPHVPAPVADAIHGALQRDRNARYESMAEFLDAMLEVLPEPSQAPTNLRGSRPGQTPPHGSSRSLRPMRPTPTPAHGMARGKLQLGPPRKPGSDPSLPPVQPANEAFAPTLHATPAPGQIVAKARSGEFTPYEMGAQSSPTRPGVPTLPPPTVAPSVAAPIGAAPVGPLPSAAAIAGAQVLSLQRQVRVLRALLAVAFVALVVVSAVALTTLRHDARPDVVLEQRAPAAPLRRATSARALWDAGAHAAHADAAVADAPTDAALAVVVDAAATPEEEGDRRSRRHRSRRDDGDDASRSSHRSRRHRQE